MPFSTPTMWPTTIQDRRLYRLRRHGNALPQAGPDVSWLSIPGWMGGFGERETPPTRGGMEGTFPCGHPPREPDGLSLVTDASLQTPPDDNLLMHAYQDRTSSRWDRQLHRERLDHRVAAGFDAPSVQNPWQVTRRHHEGDFAACFGYTPGDEVAVSP